MICFVFCLSTKKVTVLDYTTIVLYGMSCVDGEGNLQDGIGLSTNDGIEFISVVKVISLLHEKENTN